MASLSCSCDLTESQNQANIITDSNGSFYCTQIVYEGKEDIIWLRNTLAIGAFELGIQKFMSTEGG